MKVLAYIFLIIFSFDTVFADFPDIQYSWYKTPITNLQKAGIIKGQPDGTYKPDWLITRAEMLTIIMIAAKIPIGVVDSIDKCFPDVDVSMWYNKYICSANKL